MKLVEKEIPISELKEMSNKMFGGIVKAVVDIKKGIMVVDGEMHADEECVLLESGSRQDDLWGINICPDLADEDFIEYDSMINLRPRLNNFTRGIEDKEIKEKIIRVVNKLIAK